jgi:hypothetical protein
MQDVFEAQEVRRALEAEGLRAEVGPSAVSGSPYEYVYVLLTDAGFEGPHIILSEGEEYEANAGILVGLYDADGELDGECEELQRVGAAVSRAVRIAEEAR